VIIRDEQGCLQSHTDLSLGARPLAKHARAGSLLSEALARIAHVSRQQTNKPVLESGVGPLSFHLKPHDTFPHIIRLPHVPGLNRLRKTLSRLTGGGWLGGGGG
jgi:hypothetical protein